VKVQVCNLTDPARREVTELLVDSGALFTSIPRALLEGLGLKPVTRQKLRVYGGGIVERDIGGAVVEYEDRRAVVPVIFAEPEDIQVLGATTLESLGYQLDPVTKKLRPVELLMI
jgi:predicted aspartyl protease